MPSPEPAVAVLLGGGVESTALVRRFLADRRQVFPVHVHCGLIWDDCESAYVRRFCAAQASAGMQKLLTVRLPLNGFLSDHWAVTGLGVPRAGAAAADLEIPLRNLTLLAFALERLKRHDCSETCGAIRGLTPPARRASRRREPFARGFTLALGTTADNSYRDGSRDYFDKCQELLSVEAGRPVRILTPLIGLTKPEVIRSADAGDLALSFSCVDPQFDLHCGRCIKCGRRKSAFGQARVPDPTRYAH